MSIDNFNKIEKIRTYEKVIEQIVHLITSGQIKPGEKIPTERELAVKIGISRSILREAFRVMESLGIIRSKMGSGRYLCEVDANLFGLSKGQEHLALYLSFMEARTFIEVGTVTLACFRAQETDLVRLKKAVDVTLTAENFVHMDTAFHLAITAASHNPVLDWVMGSQLFSIYFTGAWGSSNQRWDEIKFEHMEIYKTIANRDSKGAEQAIMYHLGKIKENIFTRI